MTTNPQFFPPLFGYVSESVARQSVAAMVADEAHEAEPWQYVAVQHPTEPHPARWCVAVFDETGQHLGTL